MKKFISSIILVLYSTWIYAQNNEPLNSGLLIYNESLIYVEYEPKWDTITSNNLYYDIDFDGEYDIKVIPEVDLFNRLWGEVRLTSDSRQLASKLTETSFINDTSLFWYFMGTPDDKWDNPIVYNLGYKQTFGDKEYYGWIKMYGMTAPNYDEYYIKMEKSCFCTIPNYPLRWGQTSLNTGIDESESTDFATIHPNPTSGLVTITGQDLKSAEVFNTLGQQVANATGKGEQFTVDIRQLPAGIYFINITDSEGRKCVSKMVKE